MKDDELATHLLAHDKDVALPPNHERRIREGLGALLVSAQAASTAPKIDETPATRAARRALGKWLTTGLIAVAAAGGGFAAGRATAPQPPAPAPVATPPVPVPVAAPTEPPTASAPPTASTSPAPPSPPPAQDTFDREQSLLERARTALVRHDADAADKTLDEHERLFPRSRHAEERDYLRIQVLRERGDKARLRERAKAFIAKYPESMLRNKVESLTE